MDSRFEIRPGTQVIAGNDQVGRVQRLILRPDGEVEGIIISGWLVLGHDVYVPIEAVESADPNAVHLSLSLAELSRLPPLDGHAVPAGDDDTSGSSMARAAFLRSAASGQAEASAGGWPLRAGQRVAATDGDVGDLDVVLVDPRTDRATGFVVRKGKLIVRDVIVPIDWVQSVERDRISLSVPRSRLDSLPEYRPDDEITRDVLDALWYRSELGPADLQYVDVRTRDGIVELSGHTHTERTRKKIEQVARGVRGVIDVRNYLDTYEALEAAVREAQRAARQARDSP
ncbi:MAG TPA: BON domain-containing protein [Candidatus Limnocylindrales bacterium]|nr:BON domain-containing protein [Candidatus Limnocylindrales bacterium]